MEENAVAASKTIVGVNYDCLERVFQFLEFSDLINVGEANTHLNVAAEMAFARKLRKRLLVVEICYSPATFDIAIYDNAISIRKWRLAVKMIRVFGRSLPGIYLKIEKPNPIREKFFLHVNKYCQKTLKNLHIFGDHSDIFGAAEHPFGNVEQLTSHRSRLGPESKHFNRLFPRLRRLTIFRNTDTWDSRYIFETFPHLDPLTLDYYRDWAINFIDIEDMKKITRLNSQLQTIELMDYYNPYIWELINNELKHLKCISVTFSPEDAECFKGEPIRFNGVEIFDVHSKYGTVNPIDVFSFKRIKTMTLKCYGEQLEIWLDFILAHPTIEELLIWFIDFIPFPDYMAYFENVREKLNIASQNMKSISFRVHGVSFIREPINELLVFLEAQQWFTKFSVAFQNKDTFRAKTKMEDFIKHIPPIENYKLEKCIALDLVHVDFEKCK